MDKLLRRLIIPAVLIFALAVTGCGQKYTDQGSGSGSGMGAPQNISLSETSDTANENEITEGGILSGDDGLSAEEIPEFSGEPYIIINNNKPSFSPEELQEESFEAYSELDSLGRCGAAIANIGRDLMPVEDRGSIGQIKPSGWHTVKYDLIDGKYLFNRCHLIGFQLTGESANEKNLITGTRYMNVDGMLPFENQVAEYVRATGNHVLYRATPIFEGDNLLASGVQMEAMSVEDNGEGVSFNVYVYNSQPGVDIEYIDGDSRLSDEAALTQEEGEAQEYVLNTSSGKFHKPSCSGVDTMKKENRVDYKGSREKLISAGYEPCGRCNP